MPPCQLFHAVFLHCFCIVFKGYSYAPVLPRPLLGLANVFVGATHIQPLYVWGHGAGKRTKTEPSCFSPLNELSPLCDAGSVPLWGFLNLEKQTDLCRKVAGQLLLQTICRPKQQHSPCQKVAAERTVSTAPVWLAVTDSPSQSITNKSLYTSKKTPTYFARQVSFSVKNRDSQGKQLPRQFQGCLTVDPI